MDKSPFIPPKIPVGERQDDGPASGGLIISDVVGKERTINIFGGFTRDIESVSQRLGDSSKNSTLLAPFNAAIQKLPRKPWEDPKDYAAFGESAYTGNTGEDRAHRNLCRFVEAHVVTQSPWAKGEKAQSLLGETLWWEEKDGKKLILPGNIEVSSTTEVANGEVWIIKEVVNYS